MAGKTAPDGSAGRKAGFVTSSARKILQFVALSVVLTIIVGVAANWVYNRYFATEQNLRNQQSTENATRAADQEIAAAQVSVEPQSNSGGPWVSAEALDLPIQPDISKVGNSNGYPGKGRALLAAGATVFHQTKRAHDYAVFTLTGTHHTPARIVSIKAVIDERSEPPSGTVFFSWPQGKTDNDELVFDFESDDLNARAQNQNGELTSDRYLDLHTVTLAKGESVGYRIITVGPFFGTNIKFHVEASFDSGPPLEIYDNGGKPFQLLSYPRTAQRGYTYGLTNGETLGFYPCSWPAQCIKSALEPWPFQ